MQQRLFQKTPESLTFSSPKLITFTGGGGKTSIMFWLASAFTETGKRVITTTTTKIFPPDSGNLILRENCSSFHDEIVTALNGNSSVTVAQRFDNASGKLIGIDTKTLSALHQAGIADTILVEGDGAARKPLKAPAHHEPVIPEETDLCIGVMGLDSVYRPLCDSIVHRHEIFSRITGLSFGEFITPAHLITLAESKHGLFKNCPNTCNKHIFLNKIDIPDGKDIAANFADALIQHQKDINIDWFATSAKKKQIFFVSHEMPKIRVAP